VRVAKPFNKVFTSLFGAMMVNNGLDLILFNTVNNIRGWMERIIGKGMKGIVDMGRAK